GRKVPVYQATAAVKFEQSAQPSGLLVEVLSYSSADSIETQVTLIKSYPTLEEVAKRLGRLPETIAGGAVRESKSYWAALDSISSKLKVARVPNTSILEVTATSTNPREARDLANATVEAYRDHNKALRNARVTEARRFIENQLKDVETRGRRTEAEIWAFREANRIIAPGAESSVLLSLFTQVRGDIGKARQQRIEREAKTNDDLLALLKTKHQEALIKEAEQIEEVSIVRPATEPDAPLGGQTMNTILVGAVLGLSLGLVLAFVRETLDTSIGTIEDVEAYLGVPVLGVVPHIDSRETVQRILERRPGLAQIDPEALLSHSLLITHFDPKS